MSALKSRNSAFWSLVLWVTAAILVAVAPNVEGLTRCYICDYIQFKNGRSNGGKSSFEGKIEKLRGPQVEGRQSGDGDPSCASSTPKNTGLCENGCVYSLYSNKGGTLYVRACAQVVKPDGCEPVEDAQSCFCKTDLCNNGGGVSGNNRLSPRNGLYTAIMAIGAFIKLIFMRNS